MNHRVLRVGLTISALLLLSPMIAMQFTDEVNWSIADFALGGALLFGSTLLIAWGWQHIRSPKFRWYFLLIALCTLFLVWAELAVGIFGTPFAGN